MGQKVVEGLRVHVDGLAQPRQGLAPRLGQYAQMQRGELAEAVQEVTNEHVELAYVDQGYTGEEAENAAAAQGIRLEVVKLPEAKRGFVLLPRRWVVERSFGWMSRFRRLVRDYERLTTTLVGMHFVAFVFLLLHKAAPLLTGGS